jgi:hypothetical protein
MSFDPLKLLEELGGQLGPVIHRVHAEADVELGALKADAETEMAKLRADGLASAEVFRADIEAAIKTAEPQVAQAVQSVLSGSFAKLLAILASSAA